MFPPYPRMFEDRAKMAAVRTQLVDTSGNLRLAFSDLRAIDEEVAALTTGVVGLPLSEAAARASQGARTAATVASRVLKAAEAAETAASAAEAAMKAAQEAKATAENTAAAAAEAAARAGQTAAAAASKLAALEVADLEVKIQTPVPVDRKYDGGLISSVDTKVEYSDDESELDLLLVDSFHLTVDGRVTVYSSLGFVE